MKILLLFCVISAQAFGGSHLNSYCEKLQGEIVSELQCPKSGLKLHWDFCVTKDPQNRPLFFDGCTGPSGGHAELFYPACIQHDYCYHHEPASNNLRQLDCDRKFLETALKSCSRAQDLNKCKRWAHVMYRGIRGFGKLAFNCANYEAQYEDELASLP